MNPTKTQLALTASRRRQLETLAAFYGGDVSRHADRSALYDLAVQHLIRQLRERELNNES